MVSKRITTRSDTATGGCASSCIPNRFRDPAKKSAAEGAFLKVRDAYEFVKKNRSLFRTAAAARPKTASAQQREEWHAEMEALLKSRMREQAPRGLARSIRDMWGTFTPELKMKTALFSIVVILPAAVLFAAEFTRLLIHGLSWQGGLFGAVFLLACRKVALEIGAKR